MAVIAQVVNEMLYTSLEDETGGRWVSEGLDKARWKQSGASCALLSSFVPTVVALFVHVDDVAYSKLQLELTVWRVRHYTAESVHAFSVKFKFKHYLNIQIYLKIIH